VPYSAALNLYGNPDREFSEFSAQLQQVARERRQVEVDELTAKYDKQLDALEEKLQREARTLEGNRRELATSKREELFTTGEALLGLIRGQTSFTLSRMSRAQYYKQRNKSTVELNELELEQLQQNAEELQVEFTGKLQQIDDKWAAIATRVDDYQISPYKKDISVDLFGIGWLPYWYIVINGQGLMMPALNEV
jgi:hypothetical protein